jgi:hypothetical protein
MSCSDPLRVSDEEERVFSNLPVYSGSSVSIRRASHSDFTDLAEQESRSGERT